MMYEEAKSDMRKAFLKKFIDQYTHALQHEHEEDAREDTYTDADVEIADFAGELAAMLEEALDDLRD